jgi:NADH-quinone oxidoreductase E subunit|tara:strand:- start:586 stop:1194 length:609 start_codon:yes stop_codon:yes gene_type:complete
MSLKKIHDQQPEFFEFTKINKDAAEKILKKYPENKKKSAVMPFLYLTQRQNNNWIPLAGMKYIAKYLEMPYIKVYEVATFYTMYNLAPVGKYFVQICTTSPCLIRGADKVVKICKEKISKEENTLSENKLCSWLEVECLGACVNAPMMQINEDYYEDLDEQNTIKIIDSLLADKPVKPKSFRNRTSSAPEKDRSIINGGKNA